MYLCFILFPMVPEAIQTIGFRFLLGFLNHQCLEVSSTLARPGGDHQGMPQTHRELINNRKTHRGFRDQRPSRWEGTEGTGRCLVHAGVLIMKYSWSVNVGKSQKA